MNLQDIQRDADQLNAPWMVDKSSSFHEPTIRDGQGRIVAKIAVAWRRFPSEAFRDAEALCRIVNAAKELAMDLERKGGT